MKILRLSLRPTTAEAVMPLASYRAGFHSFIKKAVQEYKPILYRYHFETPIPRVKPYTFSVLFEKSTVEGDQIRFQSLYFRFVSIDPEFMVAVHNLAASLYRQNYQFGSTLLKLHALHYEPLRQVTTSPARFRTLSPVLIRSHHNERHYLVPACENFEGDPEFTEALQFNVQQVTRALAPAFDTSTLQLEPERCYRTVIKYDKNGTILKFPGFRGTFLLDGPPPLLNFLAQVGLGARRSQGFGMIIPA